MSSFVYKKRVFQYDSVFYYKPSVLYGNVCKRNQASLGHGALCSPSADQVNMSTVHATNTQIITRRFPLYITGVKMCTLPVSSSTSELRDVASGG